MNSLRDMSITDWFHKGSTDHSGRLGSFQIISGKFFPSFANLSACSLKVTPLCALTLERFTWSFFLLIISIKRIQRDQFFFFYPPAYCSSGVWFYKFVKGTNARSAICYYFYFAFLGYC